MSTTGSLIKEMMELVKVIDEASSKQEDERLLNQKILNFANFSKKSY